MACRRRYHFVAERHAASERGGPCARAAALYTGSWLLGCCCMLALFIAICCWRSLLSLAVRLLAMEQTLQFFEHGFNVVKGAVDAGEANIGDLVHVAQALHYPLTDDAAWQFLLALPVEFLLDLLHRVLDLCYREWTFLACLADAHEQFLPVKWLAPLIAFDDHELGLLHPLVGAEAPLALLAFAPAVNSIAYVA